MATKVLMEALSPTMEEGRLVEWKKNEGDAVRVGDVIAEVETDKAVMELVARGRGDSPEAACARPAPPRRSPRWSASSARRTRTSATCSAIAERHRHQRNLQPRPLPRRLAPLLPRSASPRPRVPASPPEASAGGRIKSSPLARKVARERGLDLGGIAGSGPEGRIVLRDLDKAAPAAGETFATPAARRVHRRPAHPDPEDDRQAAGAVDRADPDVLPHDRNRHGPGVGGAGAAE